MPLRERLALSQDELEFGLLMTDPYLFTCYFWQDDLTIHPYRHDLPEHWRGQQVITLEQRLMMLDGAMYMLFRTDMPDEAAQSSKKVLVRTGRKVGKTIIVESHYIQCAVTHSAGTHIETLFHTPGEAQMAPVILRIDNKVDRTSFFAMCHVTRQMAKGIDAYRVGDSSYVIHRRIEGISGTGRSMVGLRAYNDFGDEGDYGAEEPYNERQQTDLPECFNWWSGVPRGVRGSFWKTARTAAGATWSRHVQGGDYPNLHYDMRASPLYHSQTAWKEIIGNDTYDDQRVQTQVLGLDGEEARSAFPVIAMKESLPFVAFKLTATELTSETAMQRVLGRLPFDKVEGSPDWLVHADYGFSPSPMVIGISYQIASGIWAGLARITLLRMDTHNAAKFLHQIDQALPKHALLICVDAHGRGAGVLESLQQQEEYAGMGYGERVIPAGFETFTPDHRIMLCKTCKQPIRTMPDGHGWICDPCRKMIMDPEEIKPASVQSKQMLMADLADAFACGQRWLDDGLTPPLEGVVIARDAELIEELQGTTSLTSGRGVVRFLFPGGADHNTDSWLCLMRCLRRLREMDDQVGAAQFQEYGWI